MKAEVISSLFENSKNNLKQLIVEFRKALCTASTKTKALFFWPKNFNLHFEKLSVTNVTAILEISRKLIGKAREVYPNFREYHRENSGPIWFSSRNRHGLSVEWYLFPKFNIFGIFQNLFKKVSIPFSPSRKFRNFWLNI